MGAAICAAVATGVHPDFETAAARMTKERETFMPNGANGAVYTRVATTVYHDIRNHTDALFERAYPIFH
jgi:ribulose kinase